MTGQSSGDRHDGDAVDLRALMRALGRRKSWIFVPTLVALGLSAAFVGVVSPRYTGVAKVLLVNQESYYTRPDKATAGADAAPNLDTEGVQSEAEAASTPDLGRKAVKALGLDSNEEFAQATSYNPLTLALSALGLAPGGRARSEGEIVDAFLSHLTVFPIVRSRVLQIEFSSKKPELAAEGANKVARLFLDDKENAKKDSAKSAAAWLAGKIDELRAKSAEADQKSETFRAQSGLLSGANNLTMPTQQLSDLNAQMASARSAQAAALAKAQMLKALLREGKLDEIPNAGKDESLRRFAEQRVALKAQIAAESRTLLPSHPRMREMTAQLAGLDEEIRAAAAKSVRGLENEARLSAAEVDALVATLAKQSKTVATGNGDEVQLRALELDAKATRDQLESYVQKYREAIARDADNAAPADARIISVAATPLTPTFPKKAPTVALATLAGFLVALSVAASHALMSNEAPAQADAPASKSRIAAREPGPAAAREPTPRAEAFDQGPEVFESPAELARHIRGARRVLIAGEASRRSLAAAFAAAREVASDTRCAFVDLSPSDAWLAECATPETLGTGQGASLVELLAGEASCADALRRDGASPLDFIACDGPLDSLDGLEAVIAALADGYDNVILHAADWRSPEAIECFGEMDCAVLTGGGESLGRALASLQEALADAPITLYGLAESPPNSRAERAA